MITKYDLRKCRAAKLNADCLKEEIDELEAIMIVPTVQQINGMPSSHGDHDKIGNVVAKAMELRSKYWDTLHELVELRRQVEDALLGLDQHEQTLIRLYYFHGLKWEEVAVRMDYSYWGAMKLHGRILQKLAQS